MRTWKSAPSHLGALFTLLDRRVFYEAQRHASRDLDCRIKLKNYIKMWPSSLLEVTFSSFFTARVFWKLSTAPMQLTRLTISQCALKYNFAAGQRTKRARSSLFEIYTKFENYLWKIQEWTQFHRILISQNKLMLLLELKHSYFLFGFEVALKSTVWACLRSS